MAIIIDNSKIKEDIVDKNGSLITTIAYNPKDTLSYAKLSDIVENIYKIQDKIKENTPYIKELPKRNLELEELEEYRESFHKTNEILNYQVDILGNIFEDFDFVFGEKTCEKIMNGSYDIMLLMPIIEAVKPNFEKARGKKVKSYMPKTNSKNADVME